MPTYTDPTGYVGGSTGNDTFTFTQRPSGWVTIDSGAGIDRLDVDVPTSGSMFVSVTDTFNSGVFQARFLTGPYDPQVVVYDVEDVDFVGSSQNDQFELKAGATLTNLSVGFDGAGGTDFLSLDASLFAGDFSFAASGSGITSSFGNFANFERFKITTASGNDTITTGDENDEIYTGTGTDIVSTGGGNDQISSTSTGGSVDGGDGYDFYAGYFDVAMALSVTISETITVSNGIVVTNVEGASIGTGSGDDDFTVSRAIGGTVSGGLGNDTLTILGAWATSGLQITIQGHSSDQLDGNVDLSQLAFNSFENLAITGSQYDDQFMVSGVFTGSAIHVNGGDGMDLVNIDFRDFVDATIFIIENDGAISGNRGGEFENIESFGLNGTKFDDTLIAASGDDALAGGDGADHLAGKLGDDDLFGDSGNDFLDGGAGDDWLDGGNGIDSLTGGSGDDTFVDWGANLDGDTITDLSVGDRIFFGTATLGDFAFDLSGNSLTYTGGSLTLQGFTGRLVASAGTDGFGVQLTVVPEAVRNDFNGDGRSDILWRSDSGDLSNWLGQENGGFANNDANAFTHVSADWRIMATGDFNGDQRADIIWRNDDGGFSNWLGQADGGFIANDANAYANIPVGQWDVVGTGDFNGDGRDDILWRSITGELSNWLGTETGGFTSNDANAFASVPTNWVVSGTGDFNGDGFDDILWRSDSGQVSDWLGQENGGFVNNDAHALSTVSTNWHIMGTGDFNGDGYDDILWRSDLNGDLSNWLGTADGGFVTNDANAYTNAPTSWHVYAVGDYNGDGFDDILWMSDSGQLSDWLGTASGGFVNNDANAFHEIAGGWNVQPPHGFI